MNVINYSLTISKWTHWFITLGDICLNNKRINVFSSIQKYYSVLLSGFWAKIKETREMADEPFSVLFAHKSVYTQRRAPPLFLPTQMHNFHWLHRFDSFCSLVVARRQSSRFYAINPFVSIIYLVLWLPPTSLPSLAGSIIRVDSGITSTPMMNSGHC